MSPRKRARLEAAGWRVGTWMDFLGIDKPHIRKAKGNIDGRWIIEYAGKMAWAATLREAIAFARDQTLAGK